MRNAVFLIVFALSGCSVLQLDSFQACETDQDCALALNEAEGLPANCLAFECRASGLCARRDEELCDSADNDCDGIVDEGIAPEEGFVRSSRGDLSAIALQREVYLASSDELFSDDLESPIPIATDGLIRVVGVRAAERDDEENPGARVAAILDVGSGCGAGVLRLGIWNDSGIDLDSEPRLSNAYDGVGLSFEGATSNCTAVTPELATLCRQAAREGNACAGEFVQDLYCGLSDFNLALAQPHENPARLERGIVSMISGAADRCRIPDNPSTEFDESLREVAALGIFVLDQPGAGPSVTVSDEGRPVSLGKTRSDSAPALVAIGDQVISAHISSDETVELSAFDLERVLLPRPADEPPREPAPARTRADPDETDACDPNESGLVPARPDDSESECGTSNAGVCRSGVVACLEGSDGNAICDEVRLPGVEVCGNGLDDDCDGNTDEDVCETAEDCSSNLEVCDGIDNDCDGEVDEGDTIAGQLSDRSGGFVAASAGDDCTWGEAETRHCAVVPTGTLACRGGELLCFGGAVYRDRCDQRDADGLPIPDDMDCDGVRDVGVECGDAPPENFCNGYPVDDDADGQLDEGATPGTIDRLDYIRFPPAGGAIAREPQRSPAQIRECIDRFGAEVMPRSLGAAGSGSRLEAIRASLGPISPGQALTGLAWIEANSDESGTVRFAISDISTSGGNPTALRGSETIEVGATNDVFELGLVYRPRVDAGVWYLVWRNAEGLGVAEIEAMDTTPMVRNSFSLPDAVPGALRDFELELLDGRPVIAAGNSTMFATTPLVCSPPETE